MTIVAQALRKAADRLGASSDTARLDAELLMAHALGVTRSDLLLRHMDQQTPPAFDALLARRVGHEPVAYIIGRQEFYGLDLEVTPGVLIPRSDSETLIDVAREVFGGRQPPRRVLDLGTGSGALLLAALTLWRGVEGVGLERDPRAAGVARRNAQALGLEARIVIDNWTTHGWQDGLGRFDLILVNPPYVETSAELAPSVRAFEPAGALFAGPEGLDDYRSLIPQLPFLLAPRGFIVLEIGHTQTEAVRAIGTAAGFVTSVHDDLAGRPRVMVLAI